MKVIKMISALLLSIALLSSCAVKREYIGTVDSPFDTSENGQNEADNYDELFGKYQSGSVVYSNYNIEGGSTIEYNGDDIELSFDVDTSGNEYDVEYGYMAFINGIPQIMSLNGGEKGELVSFSQAPNLNTRITLSLTPQITSELTEMATLQLKLIVIFNPSYKPSGNFTGFGNAHSGRAFCEYDINVNAPLKLCNTLTSTSNCENYFINDEITEKYAIRKPDNTTTSTVLIKDAQTNEQQLTLRDGKADANLLIYGNESYKYNVYVYINHQRVSFSGGDYFEAEVKSGYLNVLHLELESIKERDIIYAVAVPTNAESGLMTARKSASVLVLNNAQNSDIPTPIETSATEQTKTPDDIPQGNSEVYGYQTLGYIDNEQQYLLLTKYDFSSSENKYLIYDEVKGEITARIKDMEPEIGWLDATCGNGSVTVQHRYNTKDDELAEIYKIDVYAANGELIKRVRFDECPENLYTPKYVAAEDCWYANLGDSFCRLSGDMSDIEKLADFPLVDFYITDDEIVYYKSVYDYAQPSLNADIFGRMDFNGNIIEETKVASYGSGHFRIGRAGKWIYFISAFQNDIEGSIEPPMNGIMLYDTETNLTKIITPENKNENAYCVITPDGKYLITGILEKENRYTYIDNIINIYDTENGELKKSISTGSSASYAGMSAFNDRVILAGASDLTVMFDTD